MLTTLLTTGWLTWRLGAGKSWEKFSLQKVLIKCTFHYPLGIILSTIHWETWFEIIWVLPTCVRVQFVLVSMNFLHIFPTLPSERGLGDGWSGDVGERVLIPCPHVTVQSPNPTLLPGNSVWWRVLCGVEKNRRGAGEGRMELIWRRIMFDWLATGQVTVSKHQTSK